MHSSPEEVTNLWSDIKGQQKLVMPCMSSSGMNGNSTMWTQGHRRVFWGRWKLSNMQQNTHRGQCAYQRWEWNVVQRSLRVLVETSRTSSVRSLMLFPPCLLYFFLLTAVNLESCSHRVKRRARWMSRLSRPSGDENNISLLCVQRKAWLIFHRHGFSRRLITLAIIRYFIE